MNSVKTEHCWETFFRFYNEQNRGRLTRLGVFAQASGVVTDYWIENGLAFTGVDLDPTGESLAMQVMLDGYSHSITDAKSLNVRYSHDAEEDGLDIIDGSGKTTILRFEKA